MKKKVSVVSTKIKESGIITIPNDFMKAMNFQDGQEVEFCLNEDRTELVIRHLHFEEKRIHSWIDDMIEKMDSDGYDIKFNHQGSVTACAVYDVYTEEIYMGMFISTHTNKYGEELGEAIAYARAVDYEIPDFVLKGV